MMKILLVGINDNSLAYASKLSATVIRTSNTAKHYIDGSSSQHKVNSYAMTVLRETFKAEDIILETINKSEQGSDLILDFNLAYNKADYVFYNSGITGIKTLIDMLDTTTDLPNRLNFARSSLTNIKTGKSYKTLYELMDLLSVTTDHNLELNQGYLVGENELMLPLLNQDYYANEHSLNSILSKSLNYRYVELVGNDLHNFDETFGLLRKDNENFIGFIFICINLNELQLIHDDLNIALITINFKPELTDFIKDNFKKLKKLGKRFIIIITEYEDIDNIIDFITNYTEVIAYLELDTETESFDENHENVETLNEINITLISEKAEELNTLN